MIKGVFVITTKYLRAGKKKGTRIKAWTVRGHKVTIPYPYELPPDERHLLAAQTLLDEEFIRPLPITACGWVPHGMVFIVGEVP